MYFVNLRINRRLAPKVLVAAVVLFIGWLLTTASLLAEEPPDETNQAEAAGLPVTPTPAMMMGGMGPQLPPVPTAVTSFYDLDQRQRGGEVFEQRCSTCHGDVGQGLTPDWRAKWPEAEQNCWKSKCHTHNHPPDGFLLPKYVPAVIGEGSLARFQTAEQLFTFIKTTMPYHAPGILDDDQYWAVTAFLLDAHRVPASGEVLTATTAANIRLRPAPEIRIEPTPESPAQTAPSSPAHPGATNTTGSINSGLALSTAALAAAVVGLIAWRRVRK